MQNVTLITFALYKGLTYFKICIFKFFHKFLNILTVRCKYSVNTMSPHYLRNSYYNLKKEKKCNCVIEQDSAKPEKLKHTSQLFMSGGVFSIHSCLRNRVLLYGSL